MKEPRNLLPLRRARVERMTRETKIVVELTLDGTGEADVSTGIGFFDHCLEALAKHASFDLNVSCQGDLHVDGHHSVEDVGICLGQALAKACGDKRGIRRFGLAVVPMDEALVEVALDFSGRACLGWHSFHWPQTMVGDFDVSLTKEFFRALTANAGLTVHVTCRCGENAHPIIEATFKALARSLHEACFRDPQRSDVPSTKGVL